jgi:hypothetical protein
VILPDYSGGSIVNLMATVARACGGAPDDYPPLRTFDAAMLADARTIVLLVVDGLGNHYVERRPESVLARYRTARMTSVFPPTTATAITTFMTGLAPQQHGVTGWHMYLHEIDRIAAILPFRSRHGRHPLEKIGARPRELFGHGSLFDRIAIASHVVTHQSIVHSAFSIAHAGRARCHAYTRLDELFAVIGRIAADHRERKLVYAYYPEIDTLAHRFGIASNEVAAQFNALDRTFANFVDGAMPAGTVMLVTADHGFIDSPPQRQTEIGAELPELAALLERPLCGERRTAYCYVGHAQRAAFENCVGDRLAGRATPITADDMIRRGVFGIGKPHPRLRQRLGDYTLIMQENYTIKDWLPGERRYQHIGVHGGASADELYVPLIVAQR